MCRVCVFFRTHFTVRTRILCGNGQFQIDNNMVYATYKHMITYDLIVNTLKQGRVQEF